MVLQKNSTFPVKSKSVVLIELAVGDPGVPVATSKRRIDHFGSIEPVFDMKTADHDLGLIPFA